MLCAVCCVLCAVCCVLCAVCCVLCARPPLSLSPSLPPSLYLIDCNAQPHLAATCAMIQDWKEKGGMLESASAEDEATARLLMSISKKCPKCGINVIRDQGEG